MTKLIFLWMSTLGEGTKANVDTCRWEKGRLYFGETVDIRDVRKTEIWFFKNWTVQKFDICSDGFPIETAGNPPFE